MLYIAMINEEKHKIKHAETYSINTKEEIEWAKKNVERLNIQCALDIPEKWEIYISEDGPFKWTKTK